MRATFITAHWLTMCLEPTAGFEPATNGYETIERALALGLVDVEPLPGFEPGTYGLRNSWGERFSLVNIAELLGNLKLQSGL